MELKKRKAVRFDGADYSATGAYFITLCTKDRKNILCKINPVGDDVLGVPQIELSPYGEAIEKQINDFNTIYSDIQIDNYVIMPNHVHLIFIVLNDEKCLVDRWHEKIPSAVSTFKRFVNKKFGESIWQRSYHDHIIREKSDYAEICKYIYENPIKWAYDKYYSE